MRLPTDSKRLSQSPRLPQTSQKLLAMPNFRPHWSIQKRSDHRANHSSTLMPLHQMKPIAKLDVRSAYTPIETRTDLLNANYRSKGFFLGEIVKRLVHCLWNHMGLNAYFHDIHGFDRGKQKEVSQQLRALLWLTSTRTWGATYVDPLTWHGIGWRPARSLAENLQFGLRK